MKVEVVPSRWTVGRRVYQRGDLVDTDMLEAVFGPGRVDGFRRLGFFKPVQDNLDGLLKRDLVELAETRGVEVPTGATKADIIELLGD